MIYLDSAATTFQKPAAVQRAVQQAMRTMSSPGRGGYESARLAEETLFRCRSAAAELFSVPAAEQVVFTMNATHGLNIAIKSLVPPGGRAIVSGYEHNAVTRPLHTLNAEVIVAAAPLFSPQATLEAFERALKAGADAAICTHVSNVFGDILPISDVARLCREAGVPLIIDASQSAGALPLDFAALGAAFIAMPGHKGLFGPQGTGLLLCGRSAQPLLFGGTGSASRIQTMPEVLPDRLEAGTHNMPGIAGLLEGLRFVRQTGIERIALREKRLTQRAAEGLKRLPGAEVFAAENEWEQTGVLSFRAEGRDCEQIGEALARRQIAVRAGLHCAPLAHRSAGTLKTGTVRISPSFFSTEMQIDVFLREMRGILRENGKNSL